MFALKFSKHDILQVSIWHIVGGISTGPRMCLQGRLCGCGVPPCNWGEVGDQGYGGGLSCKRLEAIVGMVGGRHRWYVGKWPMVIGLSPSTHL